uniref:Putative secreted protein n=1 Tax=Ixodes ricinus TaxID=34613 RepID=A0A6B0UST6_IXORI
MALAMTKWVPFSSQLPWHWKLLSLLWGLQSKRSSSRSAPAQPELSWDRWGQSWSGPEGASQASRGSWGPSSRKVPASGHRERSGSAPGCSLSRVTSSALLESKWLLLHASLWSLLERPSCISTMCEALRYSLMHR